jgi:hypothetical protein
VSHARAERMRGSGRERERRDERAEATMAALRSLPKEVGALKVQEKEKDVSGSVLLERAADRDTRRWEEEDDRSEASVDNSPKESGDGPQGSGATTSLLEQGSGATTSLLD